MSLLQGAAFGLPNVPLAMYVHENSRLPSFFGLFEMNAGPWSATYSDDTFIALLLGFLALLPVEAVFWIGFALPVPWLFGVARLVLIGAAWPSTELRP